MDFIDQLKPLIDWLHLNPGWAGGVTFLISFAESLALVGLLVPGSVMMTAIGTLIGAGVIPGWQIIAWAIAGAIVGDSLSYRLGYHYNEHLREMWPFTRYPQILSKGEAFFTRHGGKSVFLARFVGPVRPVLPLVAGMMRFKPTRFLLSNVSSAFIWAPFYMIPGMLIGAASLELDPKTAARFIVLVLVALTIIWLSAWLVKRLFAAVINYLDHRLDKLWAWLQKHKSCYFICSALKDPRQPDHHGQLTLAISFGLIVITFVTITIASQLTDFFSSADLYTYNFMQSLNNSVFNRVFIVITELGYKVNITIMALAGIAVLAWHQRWRAGLHYLAVIALVFVSVHLLKHGIDSPRPNGIAIPITSNSFPSGHTTGAVALYGFLAVLLARDLSSLGRRFIYTIAIVLCLLIMISRLYLGAHWLTDIIGGSLLGLAITMLVTISYRRKDAASLPNLKLLSVSLLALFLAVSVQLLIKFNTMVEQFTPIQTTKSVNLQSWWNYRDTMPPLFRTNRIGKQVELFNLEWLGELENIKEELIEHGWNNIPKLTMVSAINRLSSEGDARLLPIIPKLYNGKPPKLELVKQLKPSHALLVIRLWTSDTIVDGTHLPLWYGTVSYQLPRGYHPLIYKQHKQAMRRFKPAIFSLEPAVNDFCWKRIQYPISLRPTRKIHLQTWRGGVLLLRQEANNTDSSRGNCLF